MSKYLRRKEAATKLGVHYFTVVAMGKRKEIETIKIGKQIMYNVDKYLLEKGASITDVKIRRKICYCRVSSRKQKENLENQIEVMKNKYPNYEIISDIGSGLNFKREGLKKIIDYAIKGEIEILIVAYKDRLARIGYEMIENLIKDYSKGEIVIISKKEEETPQEEMTKDIMTIMNVYVAKINGLKKYKKLIKTEIKKN